MHAFCLYSCVTIMHVLIISVLVLVVSTKKQVHNSMFMLESSKSFLRRYFAFWCYIKRVPLCLNQHILCTKNGRNDTSNCRRYHCRHSRHAADTHTTHHIHTTTNTTTPQQTETMESEREIDRVVLQCPIYQTSSRT